MLGIWEHHLWQLIAGPIEVRCWSGIEMSLGAGLEQTPLLLLHFFVYDIGLVQRDGNSDQIGREFVCGHKSTLVPSLGLRSGTCRRQWSNCVPNPRV